VLRSEAEVPGIVDAMLLVLGNVLFAVLLAVLNVLSVDVNRGVGMANPSLFFVSSGVSNGVSAGVMGDDEKLGTSDFVSVGVNCPCNSLCQSSLVEDGALCTELCGDTSESSKIRLRLGFGDGIYLYNRRVYLYRDGFADGYYEKNWRIVVRARNIGDGGGVSPQGDAEERVDKEVSS